MRVSALCVRAALVAGIFWMAARAEAAPIRIDDLGDGPVVVSGVPAGWNLELDSEIAILKSSGSGFTPGAHWVKLTEAGDPSTVSDILRFFVRDNGGGSELLELNFFSDGFQRPPG